MSMIDDIKRDREAGTPDLGGWAWFGGRDNVYLATNRGGRQYVMDFVRKGMRSAQPRFQVRGVMHGAVDDLTEYQVGDGCARGQKQADADPSVYRMDVKGIDHPDARRIARVPDMEAALLAADELARVTDACLRMMDDALKGTGKGDMAIKPDGSVTLIDGWKALAAYRRATGGGE